MNHSATIVNRFLRQKTYFKSKIIMWLIGLGSLTYLLLNVYHGFDLANDKNGEILDLTYGGDSKMYHNTLSNEFQETVRFLN